MFRDFNQKQSYLEDVFSDIELIHSTVKDIKFENCKFNHCNFTDSIFEKCKFYECDFINCNLSMTSFKYSTFTMTVFQSCKMIGINWSIMAWPKIKLHATVDFYQCNLSFSNFFGLSLSEINMQECILHETDLREADFTAANFTGSDFNGAQFNRTNLSHSDFQDAINYNIDIFNNNIKKAKFTVPDALNLLHGLDIELINN